MKNNYVSLNIRMWANKTDPAMESVILNIGWDWFASKKAYEYARKIKKKRWKKAEEVIKRNPYYSYLYARHVIKGRWPEAEESIAQSNSAYLYAKYVLKSRFEIAENKTAFRSGKDIYLYSKYILKSRWKKMEGKLLAASGNYDIGSIVGYCKFVINGRWKKAEPVIVKSPWIEDYAKLLKNNELEEFENMVLLESLVESKHHWETNYAKRYVQNKKQITSVAQ